MRRISVWAVAAVTFAMSAPVGCQEREIIAEKPGAPRAEVVAKAGLGASFHRDLTSSTMIGGRALMWEEEGPQSVVVWRIDGKGDVHRTGNHAKASGLSVVPGLGEYYAVVKVSGVRHNPEFPDYSKATWDIRVFGPDGEKYHVPDELAQWGQGLFIDVKVVLPDGSILVAYTTGHMDSFEAGQWRAALIREDNGKVIRIPLYAGKERFRSFVLSGDGSVLALCLGSHMPWENPKQPNATLLFSTHDGNQLARMDGFIASSLSDNGRTIAGATAQNNEIWRDGKLLTQKPRGESLRAIEISGNGAFAVGRAQTDILVMDAASLKPLGKVTRPAEFEYMVLAISSSGKLAANFFTGGRKETVKQYSRLCVFSPDGTLLYQQNHPDFSVGDMTWAADGNVLCYLLAPDTVMRISFKD